MKVVHQFIGFSLSIILIGLLSLSSCKSTKDSQGVSSSSENIYQPLENALLWKISGNDLMSDSYLYGTIHIISADAFFYPEGTMQALETTEDLYFEINMNNMSDMSQMMGMMSEIFMKDGLTLKDLLSAEDYEVVSDHFNSIGLPIFMMERMKPMFLTAFASGDMDLGNLFGDGGNASSKSYEFELFELAKHMNKEVGGLETIEFQLEIFEKIPYKEQAKMLVDAIKYGDEGDDQMEVMTKMYTDQNINAMVNMIDEDPSGFGKYNDILLVERNNNWIPIMDSLMHNKATFFAVGAGHLAGKDGVIHLLRKEGYTLDPVLK